MLATHMISIAGVAVASQRSLATYLAVTSLPRPTFTRNTATSESLATGINTARSFFAGPRVRKGLWMTAGILGGLAIWGLVTGVIVAMFRFASQLVLDTFFSVLMGAGITMCIFETLDITLSLPRSIAYKPLFPKATEKSKQSKFKLERDIIPETSEIWIRQRKNVVAVSAFASAAIMLGVYLGYGFPLTVLPVIWIVPVVSNYIVPRMNIRRVSQFLLGYLGSIALIAMIIIPIIIHFEGKAAEKTPEEIAQEAKDAEIEAKKWTALSSWLDALMSVFQYLYIIGAPGIFIALTWRFDYTSQHSAYLGSQLSSEGEGAALIPALGDLPSFELRTAKYALGSLIACIVGLTGTHIIDRRLGEILSSTAGLVVVVPIVIAATAFGAWRHGVLKEWWTYSETWVPSADDEEESVPAADEMAELTNSTEKSDR